MAMPPPAKSESSNSGFSLRNFAPKDKEEQTSTSESFTEGRSFNQSRTRSTGATGSDTQAIANHMLGDQPAGCAEERLGFNRYVAAISEFLTDPFTKTPLALSIEGPWGSGKSSFMLQLEEALKAKGRNKVVRFNAWQYNADEGLWAAFIRDFDRQLNRVSHLGRR